MIRTTIAGFPHIGEHRDLKSLVEGYYAQRITADELVSGSASLKKKHWELIRNKKIHFIPSNDFSLYDRVLDCAVALNIVPERYRVAPLDGLSRYFAMARGHQDSNIDLKALDMKKWFITNYHYVVPELEEGTDIRLCRNAALEEYRSAAGIGITTRPAIVGPYTFCSLLKGFDRDPGGSSAGAIAAAYAQMLNELGQASCEWAQFDEPALAMDMDGDNIRLFRRLYAEVLGEKAGCRALLQTCFGDISDAYDAVMELPFDAVGLDLVDGPENLGLIEERGFPGDRLFFAGIVNGRNIWINDYKKSLDILNRLAGRVRRNNIVISTSCSLLHVPFSAANEKGMAHRHRRHLAFALEKLDEIVHIAALFGDERFEGNEAYTNNQGIVASGFKEEYRCNPAVAARLEALVEQDFTRAVPIHERRAIQSARLNLPPFPTSTIGSFPQTSEVRKLRAEFRAGRLTEEEYRERIRNLIKELIELQEAIGLDVLVHGEFERNDMVEYFGERLAGFVHTEQGWVQSYGARCVKPPIIFGDVSREEPITVDWIVYAQSLTSRPVKGMLTGPVTILNWSFPREDIPQERIANQIALAVRDEACDLEKAGIKIIQIDEAALREKLPLRKKRWKPDYLDWAVRAFRLASSGVGPGTQIQTHMCYSEFSDIMDSITGMDADVILIEAAKSGLSILESFKRSDYPGDVGPGVYDIHSPRIPGEDELFDILRGMAGCLPPENIWVNPDCGLKTRGFEETVPSLTNMVIAAKRLRAERAPVR